MNLPKAELSSEEAMQLWKTEHSEYAKEQFILNNVGTEKSRNGRATINRMNAVRKVRFAMQIRIFRLVKKGDQNEKRLF